MPLHELTATEIVRLIGSGALTAEAATVACLERISERESAVQAWEYIDRDYALRQARELDCRPVRGPLHGVPIGIKDIIATADMPTAYGSSIYSRHRPAWDAACVTAIRAAGGVIFGKTVTTEFASSRAGKTVHPKDSARTPGGSSSGSAASVADCMLPLAVGTQTGGSVVRPASFCGIVGYKPTFGWIDRHGVKPLSESLDTIGVMTRSIDDAARMVAVMAGRPALLDLKEAGRPRIAVWNCDALDQAEPSMLACMRRAIDNLAQRGAVFVECKEPISTADLDKAHHVIEYVEMGRALAFELQRYPDQLSPALRERIEAGQSYTAETYDEMKQVARQCRRAIRSLFSEFDAIIFPSALGEAPVGHQSTGNALFNRFWTALHGPVITIPAGTGAAGMPLGIQLIGAFGDDLRLLSLARWAESIIHSDR